MNLNYKDWYLVETYSRLVNAIGPDRAATTIIELGEHLEQAEQELVSRGMEPSLAQRAAFDRMGTPKKIAEAFVTAGGGPANLKWSLWLVGLLVLGIGVAEAMGWHGASYVVYILFLVLVPLAVLFATKRPLHWAAMVFGTVAISGYLMISAARTPFVNYQGFTSYQKIRTDYLALNREHGEFLRTESKLASDLRSRSSFRNLGKSFVVPNITYVLRQSQHGYWRTYESSVLQANATNSTAKFAAVPIAGLTEVPVGELDKHISRQIAKIHERQWSRRQELSRRSDTLNTPFLDRAMASKTDVTIFVWGAMISWMATFCLSRLYVKARTRARRLA